MAARNNTNRSKEAGVIDAQPKVDLKDEQDNTKRSSPGFWIKWLPIARKGAERWVLDSKDAFSEFLKEANRSHDLAMGRSKEPVRCYPIYYSMVETILSAYYARTPKTTTQRLWGIKDDIAATGSLIIERLGGHLVDRSNFDEVMGDGVSDFVHTAKATLQVCYDCELIDSRIPLNPIEGEQQIDPNTGEPIPSAPTGFTKQNGDPYEDEVFQDEQGYFGRGKKADPKTQKIYIKPAPFDETLHTPDAKTWTDIKEMAFYFSISKELAEKSFDPEVLKNIAWKSGKNFKGMTDQFGPDVVIPGQYIDGYEIYSLEDKMVYWVSESYPNAFLKAPVQDPYKFEGFFPCPQFAIQGKPPKSMFPTPAHTHLKGTLNQLHIMYERVFKLIDSVRRRAIVDAEDDVIAALNAGDQEYISAANFKGMVEKIGLDKLVWYIPVQELVQAISELNALEDRFKANAYEWFGVPDILRGVSDPIEALGTQQIKASAAHDRFKVAKKKIKTLARDAIELMVDLALDVFEDEKIATICGYDYLQDKDRQNFLPALEMLRRDEIRIVRVDLETDSLSFQDESIRQEKLNTVAQTVSNGLKQIAEMLQIDPDFASVALQTLLATLDEMDLGKQFKESVQNSAQRMIEKQMNPPPAPPPPPDYEQMKIEVANAKIQSDQIIRMRDLDQKEWKLQADEADRSFKQQLESFRAQQESVMNKFIQWAESQGISIDWAKAQSQIANEAADNERLEVEAVANIANPPKEESSEGGANVTIINAPKPETTVLPLL